MVRDNLKDIQRASLSTLIVINVHARDIIEELRDKDVVSIDQFEWISQMRYNIDFGDQFQSL